MEVKITKDNIDKILEFLPYFEDKSNIFSTEVDCYTEYPERVTNFLRALQKENFTVHFPEYKRREDIYSFIDRTIPLSEANLGDITSIFKIMMAGERIRMGGGYIADLIESGLMLKILRRLKDIRNEMD